MSENIFTPGPWEVRQHGNLATFSIVSKNGDHTLAVVGVSPGYIRPAEDEGNVRLIAAAPDMYAFLEKLVNQIEENGLMQYDAIHNGVNWVLEEAKELLSKVRGESEVSE